MNYVSIPDNEDSLYAFINLVINNKNNAYKGEATQRPRKVGWVNVTYSRNEVGEPFFVVSNLKEKCFVEMIVEQFILLRTHWNTIQSLEQYPHASRY